MDNEKILKLKRILNQWACLYYDSGELKTKKGFYNRKGEYVSVENQENKLIDFAEKNNISKFDFDKNYLIIYFNNKKTIELIEKKEQWNVIEEKIKHLNIFFRQKENYLLKDEMTKDINNLVDKIFLLIKKYDKKILRFDRNNLIGFRYEPIEGESNPFWFRIKRSANKKGKYEFIARKTPKSKDEMPIVLSKNNFNKIESKIVLILSKTKKTIDDIKKLIKEKDNFDRIEPNEQVERNISLLPHQKAGVYLSRIYDKFAFFYDTGTGKTIMSLEIIAEKYNVDRAKFLIIAPKPLIKSAWMEDAENYPKMKILPLSTDIKTIDYARIFNIWNEMDGDDRRIEIDDLTGEIQKNIDKNSLENELIDRAHHFIINMDKIRSPKASRDFMKKINVNGLIIDESAILKNPDSGNSRRARVLANKMKYTYLLSGKPAPNGLWEYYSQMKIVAPKVFKMTYAQFLNNYFIVNSYGKPECVIDNRYEREIIKMVATASITVSKSDCIEMPRLSTFSREVNMEPQLENDYRRILENYIVNITSIEGETIHVREETRMALLMKLREIASGIYIDDSKAYHISNAKLNALVSQIKKIGKEQIIIWCNFVKEIEIINDKLSKLGYKTITIYGKTKDVYENLKLFKNNVAQILIANPKTIKYGVTLTNCHIAIYNSMSYSFEDYYQARDRIYRYGQKNACTYYHMITKNTIDEIINERIRTKDSNSSRYEDLLKAATKIGISNDSIEKLKALSKKKQDIIDNDFMFEKTKL